MSGKHNFTDIYNLFFNPGEVVEIRAIGTEGKGPWEGFARGVIFGYFDNADDFSAAAERLEKNSTSTGIYFTLNPVLPDFKGRSLNRLKPTEKKTRLTGDTEIACIRWLPIDLDPVRIINGASHASSDINTSEDEFSAAWKMRDHIHEVLRGEGVEPGIPAISGNGSHLLFRLPDLKPVPENIALVKDALSGLGHKFGNNLINLDLKVFNPARIWKLYGTTARKSDHTPERPQRTSFIQLPPDIPFRLDSIPRNSVDFLRRQAALKPEEPKPEPKAPAKFRRNTSGTLPDMPKLGRMNIGAYLDDYGINYTIKQENSRTLYRIDCLFNPAHKSPDASIVQGEDGTLTYYCFHNSCQDHSWAEARTIISGMDQIAKYCDGYDPDWKPAPTKKTVIPHDDEGNPVSGVKIGEDWDTSGFLYKNDKGRMCFHPAPAAEYFKDHWSPVCYEGDDDFFWKYNIKTGVWEPLVFGIVNRTITESLGPHCKDSWVNHTRELIKKKTFRIPDTRNSHPGFLNLKNGMWDIDNAELVSHSPDFFSRVQLPVNYNDNANCPLWHKKIAEIMMPADRNEAICKDKTSIIQQFAGYTFLPVLPAPGVIFAIGDGRNGKGVVESILTALVGEENVCSLSLARMEDRFGIYHIRDKLLNTSSETPNMVLDSSTFKMVSSGERIQAERKQVSDITFYPYAKHFVSMNHFPLFKERTDSLYRRIIILEFQQRFEGDTDSTTLKDDLKAELDGIFQWALLGMYNIMEQNYRIHATAAVNEAKNRMKTYANSARQFVEECCTVSKTARCFPPEIYKAYCLWCSEGNIHKKEIFGRNAFYEQIILNYPVSRRKDRVAVKDMFFGLDMIPQNRN